MGFLDQLGRAGASAARFGAARLGALAKAADGSDDEEDDGADDGGPPNALQKKKGPGGTGDLQVAEPPSEDPRSILVDPFSVIEQMGYKERPSTLGYDLMRMMIYRMPVVHAIIINRIAQLSAFSKPQEDMFQTGCQVRPKKGSGLKTKETDKEAERLMTFMQQTGWNADCRRDRFEPFLRKVGWDSLAYDQYNFEIIKGKGGKPSAFYAVDARTIRFASTSALHPQLLKPDSPHTVQIYNNMTIAEWAPDDMAFCIRNPRTDIRGHGYGTAEVEMLVNAITAMLFAWEYNQRFFSQGSAIKGVLNFKGPISEKQLRAFRRMWYQMVSGVENAFRTPILNAEDVQWINMHVNARDMEFPAWFDFLIKIICAVFLMDPMEIGFKYGNSGSEKSMFEAANKQKLVESKDKGLKPITRNFADNLNHYLIDKLNPDFEFVFVGLEAKTPDEMATLNQKKVQSTHTVNELRLEQGLEEREDCDVILNPVWAQLQAQKQMMDAGMGPGMPGMPGAKGPPGMGDDEKPDDGEGDDGKGEIDYEKLLSDEEDVNDSPPDAEKSDVQKSQKVMQFPSGSVVLDLRI